MAVTGWKTPSSIINVDRDGNPAWNNPANAKTSNNSHASCDIPKLDASDWLRCSQFGFDTGDIPSGATIDGIEVKVEAKAEIISKLHCAAFYLRDAGGQTGDNKADFQYYSLSDVEYTYPQGGGSSDDWSAGLSDSDVRAATFGCDFSVGHSSTSGADRFAYVDCISIRVFYTAAIAHEKSLSDFMAISDSIIKAVGLNKSDSAPISDAIVKSVGLFKADTLAIADAIIKAVGIIKADTVTIADTVAKLVSLAKADAVTIADSISKAISIVKADTMAIADSIDAHIGIGLSIALSDVVTITDRLVGGLRVKVYLKQSIARMEVKGLDIARMSIKKMGVDKMPLFRWIIRRWTA